MPGDLLLSLQISRAPSNLKAHRSYLIIIGRCRSRQGYGTGKFEDGSGSDILPEYGSGSGSGSGSCTYIYIYKYVYIYVYIFANVYVYTY